jgi:hypothetical protein
LAVLEADLEADLMPEAPRKPEAMEVASTRGSILCFQQGALLVLREQMVLATRLLYLATIYQQQAVQAAALAPRATVGLAVLAGTMVLVVAVAVLAIARVALLAVWAALVAQASSLWWSGEHEQIQRNHDCGH